MKDIVDQSDDEIIRESVKDRAMREFMEERKRMDDSKVKYIVDGEGGREMIPWLKTIGWDKYLVGMERRLLLILGEEVREEEKMAKVI